MESNGCVPLLNKLHKNLTKPQSKSIYSTSIQLKFKLKNLPGGRGGERGGERGVRGGSAPQYLLEFLWIILQYSIQALCNF